MGKPKESRNPIWERKKNAIVRNYRKTLKSQKDNPNYNFKHKNDGNFSTSGDTKTFFQRAMTEYERKKADKERIKEIKEAKRKEKEEAIKRYTEKKREHFKKLSKKTKWGQPVMGGRMEILLEKIQKSYAPETIKSFTECIYSDPPGPCPLDQMYWVYGVNNITTEKS